MSENASTTPRIAFVQSAWHSELVNRIREGFVDRLTETSSAGAEVSFYEVPGAFEIPLFASRLARSGSVDAIVAAGLVVDGGIYRHEFVADAVIAGLMQTQLTHDVPVFSVVLTPHHFHEHATHSGFFHDHLFGKGSEAAESCASALAALAAIS